MLHIWNKDTIYRLRYNCT